MRFKTSMGIRNILFTYSFGLLFIVLLIVILLFSSLFSMVDEMQERVSQYISLSQFSTNLSDAREIYEELFFAILDGDEDETNILKNRVTVMQAMNRNDAQNLLVSYSQSPEKYFYSNAISNGLEYLGENQLKILDASLPMSQESYAQYYWIIKVYDYLLDYATNLYLKVAVRDDVDVLESNIERSQWLRRLTFISFAGIIAVCVLIVILFTKRFVSPVNKMAKTAEDIANGDLQTPDLQMWAPTELISLQDNMNRMKESLRNSIELERKLHYKEVEHLRMTRELEKARFLSLQAQINPHFLFNALNIISHTALFEEADQTVNLTNTLAGFMRYTLEFRNEVELTKELEFTRQYLMIQKARFGERLSYSITCPDDLKGLLIPQLLIQPFVENATKHGLEPKEEGGCINIIVTREKRMVVIKVSDDGVGIGIDKLNMDTDSKSGRVGIRNVYERLKLYFGAKADLCISRASESGGTDVVIRFPAKKTRSIL